MLSQTRRMFVGLGAAATLANTSDYKVIHGTPIRAIAFDGFAVFDPTPVFSLVKQMAPGKGEQLVSSWRTRQFEYTWLRSLTGSYSDFWQITNDSLAFAEKALGVQLSEDSRRRVMDQYLRLPCWPDATASLRSLRDLGMRLVLLSNMTPHMLESCTQNSGLGGVFDALLSVDRAKIYKPAPKAYDVGVQALRMKKEEILFVASAGWDASGAKAFGYQTYWVNRQGQPSERMGPGADGVGSTMDDLKRWIMQRGLN